MKRYIICLLKENDWLATTVELQGFGSPQTDKERLVTIATDAGIEEIELKLKEAGVSYVLAEVTGPVSYHAQGNAMAAIKAIS